MQVKNIDYLRSLSSPDFPDLGAKLSEALDSIAVQATNVEQQTNSNPLGQPLPPAPINSLTVTAQNGFFSVAIEDAGHVYRGINYWLEHADNPNFQNAPAPIDLGQSRNHILFLGNVARYFRAYSSYHSSAPSSPAYFGTATLPTLVNGGGIVAGPAFPAPQGSGTGKPGDGIQGPGIAPFRSDTGKPPIRGEVKTLGGGALAAPGPSALAGLPPGASTTPPGTGVVVIAPGGPAGPPGPSAVPPGDATGLYASGFIDPVSANITISAGITPPSPLGTFTGCALYLEIPDQSAVSAIQVGHTAVGAAAPLGAWVPIPCGLFPYVASQQPWTIQVPAPPNVNPDINTPARLYFVSFSTEVQNALVQANQASPSPNHAFTCISLASGAPTAGTSVTAVCGPIVASVVPEDVTTGQLQTPILVSISSVPVIKGWVGRLIVTYGTADPTKVVNQTIVGPEFVTAGPVQAPADGISAPHSFTLKTPTQLTNVTVWAQSGLKKAHGVTWNNIVPGITPQFTVTIGTTTGTIDAAQVILTSIASHFTTSSGQFSLMPNGVDAGVYIENATILSAKIGYQEVAFSNIGLLAVENANIALLSVATGNIQNLAITDAKVNDLSASKITAGTITATIGITAATITGSTMVVTGNGVTTTLNNGTGSSGFACGVVVSGGGASNPTTEVSDQGIFGFYNSGQQWHLQTNVGFGGGGLLFLAAPASIQIGSDTGFTGTLAAAIAASKSVVNGIIVN